MHPLGLLAIRPGFHGPHATRVGYASSAVPGPKASSCGGTSREPALPTRLDTTLDAFLRLGDKP